MSIGYACLALAVPGGDLKSCTLKYAKEERLLSIIGHNLNSLDTLIDYNIQNGIRLFRISSDLIPFGSSLARELPWQDIYSEKFKIIGDKIQNENMRISMHPGQYTVLNSPDIAIANRAVQDLDYHAKVLSCLGLGAEHKIELHLGGAYGNKKQAISRFISRYKELNPITQSRLVLENDDKLFNIGDVLETTCVAGFPAVFDNLHNAINPTDKRLSEIDWIKHCMSTWRENDGPQIIHHSQQNCSKKPGAHSESIQIDAFLEFYRQLLGMDVDIMLEVKDKNISALKCINCVSSRGIGMLEAEWAHYKYCILERSPNNYHRIRQLLRDKSTYPAPEMYRMIEASFNMPVAIGNAVNTAQHVWGYFKHKASESEKRRFQNTLLKFTLEELGLQSVKNSLLMLARKYQEKYLLNGYYFYI